MGCLGRCVGGEDAGLPSTSRSSVSADDLCQRHSARDQAMRSCSHGAIRSRKASVKLFDLKHGCMCVVVFAQIAMHIAKTLLHDAFLVVNSKSANTIEHSIAK